MRFQDITLSYFQRSLLNWRGRCSLVSTLFTVYLFDLFTAATCFEKSQLQRLMPLLEIMPIQHQFGLPYILSLMTGPISVFIELHFMLLSVAWDAYLILPRANNNCLVSKCANGCSNHFSRYSKTIVFKIA